MTGTLTRSSFKPGDVVTGMNIPALKLLPLPAWGQYPADLVTANNMTGDAPNPSVIFAGGTYYMYASQGNVYQPNVPLRTSTDLFHWSDPVESMPKLPSWATCCFTWTPDVHYIQGKYVMWFSAVVQGIPNPGSSNGRIECIGWAIANAPGGPFVPASSSSPQICQLSHLGSIDPHVFVAPDGKLWLYWKSDDNAAVSANTHSTIWVQRLASNGTRLIGSPKQFMTVSEPWEGRIVENGQMIFAANNYWFFYSANWFSGPTYAIALAHCNGPLGPCTKQGIWLNANKQGVGAGEAYVFKDATGDWWIGYAPWAANGGNYTPRPVALARLGFLPSGPYLAAP